MADDPARLSETGSAVAVHAPALRRILDRALNRPPSPDLVRRGLEQEWARFEDLRPAWSEERHGLLGLAVVANMFGVAVWREADDHLDLALLRGICGDQRLALLQASLSTRVETVPELQLGRRFVQALSPVNSDPVLDAVLEPARSAELRRENLHSTLLFLLADAAETDLDQDVPDLATVEDFSAFVLHAGLPTWRATVARIADDPWSPYAREVLELSLASGLDQMGTATMAFLKQMRSYGEERDRRTVAQEIRERVADSGLSQREFARRLGTSPSRFSSYLSGQTTPSAAILLRIRRVAMRAQATREIPEP